MYFDIISVNLIACAQCREMCCAAVRGILQRQLLDFAVLRSLLLLKRSPTVTARSLATAPLTTPAHRSWAPSSVTTHRHQHSESSHRTTARPVIGSPTDTVIGAAPPVTTPRMDAAELTSSPASAAKPLVQSVCLRIVARPKVCRRAGAAEVGITHRLDIRPVLSRPSRPHRQAGALGSGTRRAGLFPLATASLGR